MKFLVKFSLLSLLFSWAACNSDTSTPGNNTPDGQDTTAIGTNTDTTTTTTPPRPTCKLAGSVLEGNMIWTTNENLFVVISAEKETEDKELGESHRILSVLDGSCKQVFRQVLPVNFSADYPYYLSEITYNKVSKLIAIRGWDKFYVFDLATLKLAGPLVPKFLNERYAEDAQSGSIKHMEVWESYLVGYAASIGPFVYDLSNPAKPEPVLPAAEYAIVKGESYNSLFLLKSLDENDGYQALSPQYDYEKEAFQIHALFEKPLKVDPVLSKTFRNNRQIVLKELLGGDQKRPIAIDMAAMKMVALPEDIAKQKDTDIIQWMKKQK
ncbi:MAG: hypothetical protein HY842_06945 [Bacteroidetes bacterium]|nr:hypothetical protein [Bacteroidota bacterium]